MRRAALLVAFLGAAVAVPAAAGAPVAGAALPGTGWVDSTITDVATGAPVEGACLTAPTVVHDIYDEPVSLGCSDAAGHLHSAPMTPGFYDLRITPAAGSPYWAADVDGHRVHDNWLLTPVLIDGTTQDFELIRGGRITGTVIADDGGAPLADVQVSMMGATTGAAQTATDAAGHFSSGALAPGDYTVEFHAGDGAHLSERYDNDPSMYGPGTVVTVTDGADSTISAGLALGATISGTVRDSFGTPVAGACIETYNDNGLLPQWAAACSGADGQYTAGGVRPGTVHMTASAPGFLAATLSGVAVVSPGVTGVDFSLAPGRTISGHITDAVDHTAVTGGSVEAMQFAGAPITSAAVQPDGSYTISGLLPDASYKVRYVSSAALPYATRYYGNTYDYFAAVLVGTATDQTSIDIAVEMGGTLSGQVTDATGAPIEGATVTDSLSWTGYMLNQVDITDADGGFALTKLPPGTSTVQFEGPATASPRFTSAIENATISIATVTTLNEVLHRGAVITGHVSDDVMGIAVPGWVMAYDATTHALRGDAEVIDGTYRLDLGPGDVIVTMSPLGAFQPQYYPLHDVWAQAEPVTVTEGATSAEIDFVMHLPAEPAFAALAQPVRLLDTRPGRLGVVEQAMGAADIAQPLAAETTQRFVVTGVGGLPVDPAGVAFTVTAVAPSGNGYLTLYPCASAADAPPATSTLNMRAGVTIANAAILRPTDGGVCVRSSVATHVILDATGTFAGQFVGRAQPLRLLDTRPGQLGVMEQEQGWGDYATMLPPRSSFGLRVFELPPSFAGVTLNITVVNPTAAGYVSIERCPPIPEKPTAGALATTGSAAITPFATSTINFAAGVTIANSLTIPTGLLCVRASAATHLIIDLTGYFESGTAGMLSLRLADTRPAQTGVIEQPGGSVGHDLTAALAPGVPQRFALGDLPWPVPADPAGFALNLTAVGATSAGYLTAYPCDSVSTPVPATSSLNFVAGMNQATAVYLDTDDATGGLCVVASQQVHLIIDGPAWFV